MRILKRERGQTAVEFALCATVFFMIVFGLLKVAVIYGDYTALQHAARDGARAAALSGAPTTTGDTTSFNTAVSEGRFAAICSVAPPPCTSTSTALNGMTVAIVADTPWTAGAKVRATVSAPYSLSLFGIINVASGTMSVSDVMRVHRQGA